jgi:hypothetical protein
MTTPWTQYASEIIACNTDWRCVARNPIDSHRFFLLKTLIARKGDLARKPFQIESWRVYK